MPRKTKKQKTKIQNKRLESNDTLEFSYSAPPKQTKDSHKKHSADELYYALLRKDIYKTLILAILFVSVEIALYLYTSTI